MRLVVLGTGTGVGKTSVTVELVRGIQPPLPRLLALKPIETGFAALDDRKPAPGSDAAQLEAAAFHVQHPRPHPLYAFTPGISPHLAAERARCSIELERIASWVQAAEEQQGSTRDETGVLTVIETAGGVFSPLSVRSTGPVTHNYDLALALQAELWLLVAPDRLGVLHDVAATMVAMTQRGRVPDALVLTPPAIVDASTGSNAGELRRLHPGLLVLMQYPHLAGPRDDSAAGQSEIVRWLEQRVRR